MAARGVNKVIIVGNLGRDPEIRYTPGGDAIANLTVATSEGWKDKQTGENKEITEWHRVVAYGRLAQIMGEYLRKGSKVYIEGSLRTRQWEKDGQKHYTTEIRCNEMQMLDSARSGGGSSSYDDNNGGYSNNAPQQQRSQAPKSSSSMDEGFSDPPFDEDIPF